VFIVKVPNRTHYALKILVDLAMCQSERPSTVTEIAQRQRIPRQFLHQILLMLKACGMVRSRRGVHGGYLLAASPDELNAASVVRATQGELLSCPQHDGASRGGVDAAICGVWAAARARLAEELEAVTIRDLCMRVSQKTGTADYVI